MVLAEGAIGKNPQATGPIDEGVLSLALEAQQAATLGCFAILTFKGVVQRFTGGQKQIVAPTLVKVPCLRSLTNPLSAHWSASGGIVRQTGSGRSSIEAMAFGSWSSVSLASALHPGYVLVGLSAFTSSAPAGFQLGSAIFAHPKREGGVQRLD